MAADVLDPRLLDPRFPVQLLGRRRSSKSVVGDPETDDIAVLELQAANVIKL
jgi:hypothetical protein